MKELLRDKNGKNPEELASINYKGHIKSLMLLKAAINKKTQVKR